MVSYTAHSVSFASAKATPLSNFDGQILCFHCICMGKTMAPPLNPPLGKSYKYLHLPSSYVCASNWYRRVDHSWDPALGPDPNRDWRLPFAGHLSRLTAFEMSVKVLGKREAVQSVKICRSGRIVQLISRNHGDTCQQQRQTSCLSVDSIAEQKGLTGCDRKANGLWW